MDRAAISLLLLLLAAPIAAATGRLEGRILDLDGRAVSGIMVEVEELAASAISDGSGFYRIEPLPAGIWAVSWSLLDQTDRLAEVPIEDHSTTILDLEIGWAYDPADTAIVHVARQRRERLAGAPGSITVVGDAQLQRNAAHGQLPKLFEFAPGAEVVQNGVWDFSLNARGFNSSLGRRVAVRIDGRDPSMPFLGAQEWAAMPFPLDELESVELVRGPEAAVFGANASAGVLDLTTRSPRDSSGGSASFSVGELNTTNFDFRWAGLLGEDWSYRIDAGHRENSHVTNPRIDSAEYSQLCTDDVRSDCLPAEVVAPVLGDDFISFSSLRLDRRLGPNQNLSFEAGVLGFEGPVIQTSIGRVQLVEVNRPYARAAWDMDGLEFRFSWTGRNAPQQLALASGTRQALDSRRFELDGRWRGRLFDHRLGLLAGATVRRERIDSYDPDQGRQTLLAERVETDRKAFFIQGEWSLTDSIELVGAARWDDSDFFDSRLSPKLSIVWAPRPDHTLRLGWGEAFQIPSQAELRLRADLEPSRDLSSVERICGSIECGLDVPIRVQAVGNPDLDVEKIRSLELGYSARIGRWQLGLDLHRAENVGLITDLVPRLGSSLGPLQAGLSEWTAPAGLSDADAAAVEAELLAILGSDREFLAVDGDGRAILARSTFANFGEVNSQGIDLGLTRSIGRSWRGSLAWSWFDYNIQSSAPGLQDLLVPNTPDQRLSVAFSFLGERFGGSLSGRFVDDFRWVAGPFQGRVESYSSFDLALSWRLNQHWSTGFHIANLTDDEHWQSFGGDVLGRRALAFLDLSW